MIDLVNVLGGLRPGKEWAIREWKLFTYVQKEVTGTDGCLWLVCFYDREMFHSEDLGGPGNYPRYSIDRISLEVSAERILLI